jgi:hypothetical protein
LPQKDQDQTKEIRKSKQRMDLCFGVALDPGSNPGRSTQFLAYFKVILDKEDQFE